MSEATIIVGLCTAITAMAVYIVSLHDKHAKAAKAMADELKTLLISQISTATEIKTAIENNTKAIDKSLEKRGK